MTSPTVTHATPEERADAAARAWVASVMDVIPACVVYSGKSKGKALVCHPCGDDHPNAVAARARLRMAGWTVLTLEPK